MTFIIACILLAHMGANWWDYLAVFVAWVLHVAYHSETPRPKK